MRVHARAHTYTHSLTLLFSTPPLCTCLLAETRNSRIKACSASWAVGPRPGCRNPAGGRAGTVPAEVPKVPLLSCFRSDRSTGSAWRGGPWGAGIPVLPVASALRDGQVGAPEGCAVRHGGKTAVGEQVQAAAVSTFRGKHTEPSSDGPCGGTSLRHDVVTLRRRLVSAGAMVTSRPMSRPTPHSGACGQAPTGGSGRDSAMAVPPQFYAPLTIRVLPERAFSPPAAPENRGRPGTPASLTPRATSLTAAYLAAALRAARRRRPARSVQRGPSICAGREANRPHALAAARARTPLSRAWR